MKTKVLVLGFVGLVVLSVMTCDTFGWCTAPYVYFTFWPKCYDESTDTYYVPYDRKITIDADVSDLHKSYDPDCSGCSECDEGSLCSGIDLIRGLRKYRWYFGDGIIEEETCSSQDDEAFDANTDHTYTSTGSKTLKVRVYDVDETCDNGCPPGWGDKNTSLSKQIVVVKVDLDISGVADADEEDPGAYILVNDDDDNNDCTADSSESETVTNEDDLVGISLSVSPALSEGKMQLNRSSYRIKVWDSPTKDNLVLPDGTNDYIQWDISSFPSTLYVEGVSRSYSLRDTALTLSYLRTSPTCSVHTDTVKITVVQVDLDVSNVYDSQETCKGGYVALNDDDDNGNDTFDKDETGPITGEDDLVQITLQDVYPTALTGPVTLKALAGGSKIKVWTTSTKGTQITLPKTYSTPTDLPKTLYVEGYDASGGVRDITLALEYSVGGNTFDDRIKVTVVDIDVDVDSDNNNELDAPDRSSAEEQIENDDDKPGKYMMVNDDDNDDDGIPDFADGFDWDESGGNDDDLNNQEKFVPIVVQITPELPDAEIWIFDAYSDPANVVRGGTAPDYTYTAAYGNMRMWTKDGNQARNKAEVKDSGDYIDGGLYTASELGFGSGTTTKTFYMESIRSHTELPGWRLWFMLDPDGDGTAGWIANDVVCVTIIRVDVDVDTDNDDGKGSPDGSLVEDHYEDKTNDSTGSRPGKYVEINHNDDDNDGVPDFADGFNLKDDSPGNADNSCSNEDFVELDVTLESPIDLSIADINVSYSAGNPSNVIRNGDNPLYHYFMFAPLGMGHIRIWTKEGNQDRNKASAKAASPGDYVEPGVYDASQLGFDGTRTKTFYVEGIWNQTSQISDKGRIKFDVDPDGSSGNAKWVAVDAVRTMIVKSDLDIDVDNDGATHLRDDPIEDKTPGAILPKSLDGDCSEDYRRQIKLYAKPALYNGEIILDKSAAGIKAWTASSGGTEVTLPKTYTPSTLPSSLWVDGTERFTDLEITLEYKDKNSLKVAEDKANVLVTETISWAPAERDTAYVWASLMTNDNNNPGNNLGWGDADTFEDEIKDQGWNVVWYADTTGDNDANFEDCTINNYIGMCDCGIFTVVSHGEPGAHDAVYAELTPGGRTAVDNWVSGQAGMTRERWDPVPGNPIWPEGCYVARVSSNWLSSNWKSTLDDNKAIAMWSICYSADSNLGPPFEAPVKEAAGGRWRSGYIAPTYEGEAIHVNSRLLRRMNGKTDNAERRTAGEAWQNGTGYEWDPPGPPPSRLNARMDGNDWTTLCPAPMLDDEEWPDANPGNRYGWGCIIFDTYMNDSVSPTAALTYSGGTVCGRYWRGNTHGDYMLGFVYDKTDGTATTMTAHGNLCKNKDPSGGRVMDQDRVAPSIGDPDGDDREWSY